MEPIKGKYCSACGALIDARAEICPKCGVRQTRTGGLENPENKRWLISLLLCVFLGELGVHRFYTGHIFSGILMLITCGGLGIWWIIDLIFIAIGDFRDADGNLIDYRSVPKS